MDEPKETYTSDDGTQTHVGDTAPVVPHLGQNILPVPAEHHAALDSTSQVDYDIYRAGVKRLVLSIVNLKFPEKKYLPRTWAYPDQEQNCFKNYCDFEALSFPFLKTETDQQGGLNMNSFNKKFDCLNNLDFETMDKVLHDTAERIKSDKVGCLAVIISSHGTERPGELGNEHCIVCSDGLLYKTQDMINILHSANKGLPIVFVLQACRTETKPSNSLEAKMEAKMEAKIDRGVTVLLVDKDSDEESGGPVSPPSVADSHQEGELKFITTPCAPNCVVLFSSASGKEAYLGSTGGSLALRSINFAMKKHAGMSQPLFLICTAANHFMSEREIPKTIRKEKVKLKSTGCFIHQLLKRLSLNIQVPRPPQEQPAS